MRLFGGGFNSEKLDAPWDPAAVSLYDYLYSDAFTDAEAPLPGADKPKDGITFAAGLMDNIGLGPDMSDPDPRMVAQALRGALTSATSRKVAAFYAMIRDAQAIALVDDLVDALFHGPPFDVTHLKDLALWIAKCSPDPEPVKIAIALLGMLQEAENRTLFLHFGRHEEFASFVVPSLLNGSDQAEDDVWHIARDLKGWGRIAAVERLADTDRDDIKDWILRHGFRNSIMDEYLACLAARTGDLVGQLRGPSDPELLDAAAGIFSALTTPYGPAETFEDYEDAQAAARLFLAHVKEPTLPQSVAVLGLRDYAQSEDVLADQVARMNDILSSDAVTQALTKGLGDRDNAAFWQAKTVARALGWDVWPHVWARHTAGLQDLSYDLMQSDDPARIEQVLKALRGRDDLEDVAGPPDAEFSFAGPESPEQALDMVVQELRRFPGLGGDLVLLALRGRSIRLRSMAYQALEAWGQGHWPDDTKHALEVAKAAEPDADLAGDFAALLAGSS